jgi:hypothetical protein
MIKDLAATFVVMAYAGELINPGIAGTVKTDDEAFGLTTASNTYLPRLQLMTSNSQKCKDGEFPINNFTLTDSTVFDDLGKEVDVLVLAWRPFALDTSGDSIISAYDPATEIFQKIVEKADTTQNSGCIHGPQFLVWVPSKKKFATLTFGSVSARKEAATVKNLMHKACTLKGKKIETKKYTWYVTTGVPCNTPFDLPAEDQYKAQIEKFINPPASEVEAAPATGRER